MPVRRIPKNHIHVTGRHASAKAQGHADFESPLEWEYLILLDFDPRVERYEVQPVRVPVPGVPRGYVPDVLVHFCPDALGHVAPSELTEIKTAEDYRTNEALYAPKFAAAEQFARERGWQFVRKSDKDIRTARLKNIKFLRSFLHHAPQPHLVERVLLALSAAKERHSSSQALAAACATDQERAELLPVIWHLLATGQLDTHWDTPFGADVPLWRPAEAP